MELRKLNLTDALKNGSGHIGYSIRKEYRGKGYATIGLKLTLEIARTIVPEDEIYLRLLKSNKASLRVMEKTFDGRSSFNNLFFIVFVTGWILPVDSTLRRYTYLVSDNKMTAWR